MQKNKKERKKKRKRVGLGRGESTHPLLLYFLQPLDLIILYGEQMGSHWCIE